MRSRCPRPDGCGSGRRCPPPGVENWGVYGQIGRSFPPRTVPDALAALRHRPVHRPARSAGKVPRRRKRCRSAVGRAQERIGRACLGPSWQRSRQSVAGCRAAAERRHRRGGVAAVRIHRSILVRCRGRRAPLARGGRHRRLRPRPKFREPDPERLPQHGRPLERRPGKGGPPVRERHGREVMGRPRPLAVLQVNGDDRNGERIPAGGVGRSRDVELLPDRQRGGEQPEIRE